MYEIPVVPGDGIGPDVIREGRRVLSAAADAHGFDIEWREYDFGAERYLEDGTLLPDEAIDEIGEYDAIYFGSVGDPRVEPGVLERGIILELRFAFDQYVNLRPVELLAGIETPLEGRGPEDIDFTVIRENTEDFYIGIGGRSEGSSHDDLSVSRELYDADFSVDVETDADEIAYQVGAVTREGTERIVRYAFEHARANDDTLVTSIDKANVMSDVYGLWREVVEDVSAEYDDIDHEFMYADAAAMDFVRNPDHYQTVVSPNMFGDILTDLGAMLQGGIGLCPGANINPEGTSLFEPLHGSAPDIAGTGTANPTATIWAGALLLDHIGESEASDAVLEALHGVLGEGETATPDLGGDATTEEFGRTVAERVARDR